MIRDVDMHDVPAVMRQKTRTNSTRPVSIQFVRPIRTINGSSTVVAVTLRTRSKRCIKRGTSE